MAAMRDGVCIDTTMGLTPAGGLVMGTRCGDIDPGILRFLADELGMSPAEIDRAVNHESGLRGLSATSADVRDLLAARGRDPRAALALDVFCHSQHEPRWPLGPHRLDARRAFRLHQRADGMRVAGEQVT